MGHRHRSFWRSGLSGLARAVWCLLGRASICRTHLRPETNALLKANLPGTRGARSRKQNKKKKKKTPSLKKKPCAPLSDWDFECCRRPSHRLLFALEVLDKDPRIE